jgi:sigma54-dependent transcription regulator
LTVAENSNKENFFYPIGRYRGEFTPEQLAFNANLQEFAQRVSIVCGLETGGKISTEDAYDEIKRLWKELKQSKKALIDQTRPPTPDLPEDSGTE